MSCEGEGTCTSGDACHAADRGRDIGAPCAPAWSRRIIDRAREAAGRMSAPVWLWGCTHVGSRPRTLGRPRVLNRGQIEIRDDVVIDSRFSRTELVTAPGGRIVIGSGTFIEHGVMVVASRLVELGDRVALGAYCIVSDSDSPDLSAGAVSEEAKPIWIGDEVVIGARVTVLPGATIGARSRILAGSIVSGEIPPGVVAGGSPARPLRKLRLAPSLPTVPPPAVSVTPSPGRAADASPGAPR
jgi:acetyltransferase-like isoleucine patch superfamily enzyme